MEHLSSASSRDSFKRVILRSALFSASGQTHCTLVVCDSEWVSVVFPAQRVLKDILQRCSWSGRLLGSGYHTGQWHHWGRSCCLPRACRYRSVPLVSRLRRARTGSAQGQNLVGHRIPLLGWNKLILIRSSDDDCLFSVKEKVLNPSAEFQICHIAGILDKTAVARML